MRSKATLGMIRQQTPICFLGGIGIAGGEREFGRAIVGRVAKRAVGECFRELGERRGRFLGIAAEPLRFGQRKHRFVGLFAFGVEAESDFEIGGGGLVILFGL